MQTLWDSDLEEKAGGRASVAAGGVGRVLMSHGATTTSTETAAAAAGKNLIAGTVGGMVAKLVEFPLDTIKVRMQSLPWKYTGVLQCARLSFSEHGVIGFYKGIASPLVGTGFENAIVFASNGAARRQLDPFGFWSSVLGSGAFAGSCAAFISCPVELIKCRLQAQPHLYRNSIDCARKTIAKDGARGLFQGFWVEQEKLERSQLIFGRTVGREVPGTAVWFGAYELVLKLATPKGKQREDLPVWAYLAAGGAAGSAYWIVPFPFDVVKSRAQTYAGGRSYLEILREIYRENGLRGFYRGLGVTLVRAAPANAVIFGVYEYVYQLLTAALNRREESKGPAG